MRVGKRRIKVSTVPVNAFAHRALEGRIGPGANPGFDIGGDVGAVDDAERRLQRAPARERPASFSGVAAPAISDRSERRAFGDEGGLGGRAGGGPLRQRGLLTRDEPDDENHQRRT